MPQIKFYDVKGKKTFLTDKYRLLMKSGRRFAVAKAPSGIESYRIVSKDFYNKHK